MNIVAIVSAKGGVGKTTLCANLAVALRLSGREIVVVDLDPQNALHYHLGLDLARSPGSARVSLQGGSLADACIVGQQGVLLVPYGAVQESERQHFEQVLDSRPHWVEESLSQLGLSADAIVLLDTPPGPSVYLRQALVAADLVLVAMLADAASYATLPLMENLIETYCRGRPGFLDHAYIINQANQARQLSRDVAQVMRLHMGHRIAGVVHQDQAVGEALACGQSVLEYDPQCQGAADIVSTADWIINRLSGVLDRT